MHTHIHTWYTYMCTHTHTHTHTYAHTHTHKHTCTHTLTYTHTYVHTHSRTYARTHTHTHNTYSHVHANILHIFTCTCVHILYRRMHAKTCHKRIHTRAMETQLVHLYNVNMWHANKRSTFTQNKGKVIECCIAMSVKHDAVGGQCCWWFLGFSATDNNSYPSCLFLKFSVARDVADISKSFAPLTLISMLSPCFTLQEASRERTIVTQKNHPLGSNDNKEIAVPGIGCY